MAGKPLQRGRARRVLQTPSALDTSQTIAATQQLVSFACFIAAEGYLSMKNLPAETSGRAGLVPTGVAVAATLAATGLIQSEATQAQGAIFGIGIAALLMAYYLKRAADSKGRPTDWPGPKAPLAGMALVSFFVVNIFREGLS